MLDSLLSFIKENSTLLAALGTGYFGYKASTAGELGKRRYENLKSELQDINQVVVSDSKVLAKVEKGVLGNRRRLLYRDLRVAIERGYTSIDERREIGYLYQGYSDLGGNGEIETMYLLYLELPIREVINAQDKLEGQVVQP